MKKKVGFEELYVDCLKDLYDAENQILKALPKLVKEATSPELKKALEMHRKETEGQVERLDQIFISCGEKPTGKKCMGMRGVLEEGEEHLKELKEADPVLIDAAIIASAQKVEHYEIASYGTARAFARLLNDSECEKLLDQTIKEEGNADKKLTSIAESSVNLKALEVEA